MLNVHKKMTFLKTFLAVMLIVILLTVVIMFQHPHISSATMDELKEVHGLKVEIVDDREVPGIRMKMILDYISNNPDAKIEDLRILNGIDDMVIDQLNNMYRD